MHIRSIFCSTIPFLQKIVTRLTLKVFRKYRQVEFQLPGDIFYREERDRKINTPPGNRPQLLHPYLGEHQGVKDRRNRMRIAWTSPSGLHGPWKGPWIVLCFVIFGDFALFLDEWSVRP